MSEFPWNQFWIVANAGPSSSENAHRLLSLIQTVIPIHSLSLFCLAEPSPNETGSQGMSKGSKESNPLGEVRRVLYSETNRSVSMEPVPLPCSVARWIELFEWAQSGSLLQQRGPKPTGKLSWLAPQGFSGSLIAIPLRVETTDETPTQLGIAVFEVASGRSLPAAATSILTELRLPLARWLQNSVTPRVASHLSPSLESDQESNQVTQRDEIKSLNESGSLQEPRSKESIIGAEQGLKAVMERVALVANSDLPVLILGDTGTGKEVIARAIHSRSSRCSKPFLRVNCGAIPSELIDSQLFGHERGSFTGASDQRKGWFERADGGTLFLDEIGELTLAAQVRLLRVLQEHQIERVGGEKTIQVDVRIIAATHRDLTSMVHDRTFREDLWYRINLFPILLPKLCERLEDIPSLTKHFTRKAAARFGVPYADPTSADIDRLLKYPWPGNVRELQAVIDRAVILGRGQKLDIQNALGLGLTAPSRPSPPSEEPTFYEVVPESAYTATIASTQTPTNARSGTNESNPILPLNEMLKQHIERALLHCNGQVEGRRGAAKLLQINPHTLRAKMRKLGIRWADFRQEDE